MATAQSVGILLGTFLIGASTAHSEILRTSDLLLAQDDALVPDETADLWSPTPWRVQIEPMIWYAGMQGELQAPGSTGEPEIEDLRLDDSNIEIGFEVLFRDEEDEHTLRFSGFLFTQDANTTADGAITLGDLTIAAGESFRSNIDFASIEASYSWPWLRYSSPSATGAQRGFNVRVDPYVGLRAYDLRFEVTAAGGDVNESMTWADVVAGVRLEAEFSDEFSWDLAIDAGGFWLGDKASSSANILTGFQWRPSRRFGAQIGYRFLFSSYSDDDGSDETRFSGSLAGMYGSLVWRF